jgi:hypothetical protein
MVSSRSHEQSSRMDHHGSNAPFLDCRAPPTMSYGSNQPDFHNVGVRDIAQFVRDVTNVHFCGYAEGAELRTALEQIQIGGVLAGLQTPTATKRYIRLRMRNRKFRSGASMCEQEDQ